MATPSSSSKAADAAPVAAVNDTDFSKSIPLSVDYEDTMSERKVKACWTRMMEIAGLKNPGESKEKQFRCAVYVYGALNGTSREGNYEGMLKLADGTEVRASCIPQAVGQMSIRKFFRGCSDESYRFFKSTGVMESYPRFVAKAAEFGVSAETAFATADWFRGYHMLTPAERKAQNDVFSNGLERAKRSRGGETLEQIEQSRVKSALKVQGPLHAGSASEESSVSQW